MIYCLLIFIFTFSCAVDNTFDFYNAPYICFFPAVTTNELDINITITVLAALFTIGIFIIVAVLLR